MDQSLTKKEKQLKEIILKEGRVAVAVSGGVDSTLLLKEAFDVLGHENVLGLFASSSLQPQGELEHIKAISEEIGCRLKVIELDPLSWAEFVANPSDRCYLCKNQVYTLLLAELVKQNISCLMDGTNIDDLSDYRPGLHAVKELGVRTPFVESGLRKTEIRLLSKQAGLSNWDRPSASCLATRIPAGTSITKESLDLVSKCEKHLHTLGFQGCRVRLVDGDAHIELAEGDMEKFIESSIRLTVVTYLSALGFGKVLLNLSERKRA